MPFLQNVLGNLLANIVFWLVLGLLTLVYIRFTKRRFLRFFGIEKGRRIVVYLSNLYQPDQGDPRGCILSGQEFRVAKSINTLFGDAPFRLPEVVRGLVDGFWLGKKLHIEVDVAPLESGNIQFTNMIVVGGTPKNSVRRYYMDAGLPWVEVVGEDRPPAKDVFARTLSPRLRIRKGKHTSEEIPGSYNVAIVEKIVDGEHRTTVFFCVGFRGDCSRGAVEYLARNWRTLHHRYGNQSFAVCLGFPRSENEMESYMAPDILRQIQT